MSVTELQKAIIGELRKRGLPNDSIVSVMLMSDDEGELSKIKDYLKSHPEVGEKQILIEAILHSQSKKR